MATPRLPFLWPFLYRAARPCPPRTLVQTPRRGLKSSRGRQQEISTQRYGTANEPPPQLQPDQAARQTPSSASKVTKTASKSKKEKDTPAKEKKAPEVETAASPAPASETTPLQIESPDPAAAAAPSILSMPPPSSSPNPKAEQPPADPISQVLNMPPPSTSTAPDATTSPSTTPTAPYYHENASSEDHRPPHISTPRYVHHFDTYSLVRALSGEAGGWTPAQAITVMKAVRVVLRDNMELARDGLVSKSNVENETYLFRAACSELRTEVGMRRKAETEKTRSERTGLQHEVDILGQRVGMEAGGLREELKGMVEGRKMVVREEGRGVDSKIQELNYRITVALNSDLRSDVEGVRWIITKRAVTALAICALMVIAGLKYASGVWEEERKRSKAVHTAAHSHSHPKGEERHPPAAMNGEELGTVGLLGGENPGYISLG